MAQDIQQQLNNLKNEIQELRYILSRKTGLGSADIKGRIVAPSNVGGSISIGTGDITITGTNTSGTASVSSGSIPIGYFLTAFTTPAASYVQLVVSGTTLTATLSVAPGAGNSISIRIILLKP